MARTRGRGRGRGRGRTGGDNFLGPRSGRQASRAANAQANAEFGPEIRQIRQQVKGSRKRGQSIGQWYDQLAADYQGAQDAGAAALQSVQDATTQQLREAADRNKSVLDELAEQDAGAAKLGGTADSQGLSKIAQAGAAAERARVALTQPVAQEQANFVGRVARGRTAARMRGMEARTEERNRRDKLLSDLTGARKDKGAARVSRREEIRDAERSYSLDREQMRLTRKEARAAEQQAEADAALAQIEASRQASQDAIDNRQEQERIGISRKNARTSARSQRSTARNQREENKGGLSTAEKRARGEHSSDAMSAAKAQLAIKVPKTPKQWAQFEAALIEKLGSSYSAEAAAAVGKLRRQQAAKSRGGYDRRIRRGKAAGPPTPNRLQPR